MFQRNNRIWCLVCKSSSVASNQVIQQTRWYNKRISRKGYSVPRDLSWIKNYKLISNKPIATNLKPKKGNLKDQKLKTQIKRPLETLRNFILSPIYWRWYDTELFDIAVKDIKTNAANPRRCLLVAAALMDNRYNDDFLSRLEGHTEIFTIINPSTRGYAMAEDDDYLFRLAKKTRPIAFKDLTIAH